jgi:hypothetical protein
MICKSTLLDLPLTQIFVQKTTKWENLEETLLIQWADTVLEYSTTWCQESFHAMPLSMMQVCPRILGGKIDQSQPTSMTSQVGKTGEMEPLLRRLEMSDSTISRLLIT